MTNVTVTSVIKLTSQQVTKIKTAVEKKYGSEVSYVYEVDPSILGGVIITVNSKRYDGSVRNKLNRIKQELNKKISSK